MVFLSNAIQYNTIQYNTIQYNRFNKGVVTPEQGILLDSSTPEQVGKFKTPVAHTRLIKVESLPPPLPRGRKLVCKGLSFFL